MQRAIPYTPRQLFLKNGGDNRDNRHNGVAGGSTGLETMVTENAVVVIGIRGCCMSHVMKRLLLTSGVNPAVYEVEEGYEVRAVDELEITAMKLGSNNDTKNGGSEKVVLPAVFIGGKLFGGLDKLMASHISGELVPALKQAGALWL